MREYEAENIAVGLLLFFKACIRVFLCDQLENGVSHRESKRSIPFANDLSGPPESSSCTAEHNFVTETTHNG